MAARTRVLKTSTPGPAVTRHVATSLLLAGVLSAGGVGSSASGAAVDQEAVFLPAGEGRTLDHGPAGWTATTLVTAVGCVQHMCPVSSAQWVPGVGPGGSSDGALAATLRGLSGQSGVANVVWRSPVFLVPPNVLDGTVSVALRAVSDAEFGASYRVRLVPLAGGNPRTLVEEAPIPGGGHWTPGPVQSVGVGAFPLDALHRLEVELQFRFGEDDARDRSVLLDLPTLALRTAASPPAAGGALAPSLPGPARPPAMRPEQASERSAPLTAGAALATCRGEEALIVGVGGLGRRLTVSGASSRPAGASVELFSTDGWPLGRTAVAADGTFAASVREPRGSAGAAAVMARLADGEQSAAVRVERDHVVRAARITDGVVQVQGRLRRHHGAASNPRVTLLVSGAAPCAAGRRLPAASVRFEPHSGNYRATAALPPSTTPHTAGASLLVRSEVAVRSPGRSKMVTESQPILVRPSGIGTG